jgi:hypothetical protein
MMPGLQSNLKALKSIRKSRSNTYFCGAVDFAALKRFVLGVDKIT